ncbi:MAG TPA: LPS export ABC transporter permease LptF [Terriglobales bacterium]|jgi:LPS export ABC transporter permease LptF/LPS export ABC transporter permease LptG
MRILTRYILREVLSHAGIGIAVFTFVLFTRDLGRILDLVARASAPLPSVAELFFFTVPVALTYTIPMGVLVGILIGFSRLAADSEITAMRASGMGVWSFLRIIAVFVLGAWGVALVNGIFVAPRSQAALGRLSDKLKTSQASFEVQSNVFYEGFPKLVLYVQSVHSRPGAAEWKGVFLADVTDPAAPRITLAENGILVSEGPQTLHLHLNNGSTHETVPGSADRYQISTFAATDIPITLPAVDVVQPQSAPAGEMATAELWQHAHTGDALAQRWNLIELHRRFSLSTACLVLALVGIPLGLSSKKGGKSAGFVLTILLVFAYYSVSLVGVSLAREGRLSPALGVWLANILFFAFGVGLLWRVERSPIDTTHLRALIAWFKPGPRQNGELLASNGRSEDVLDRLAGRRRTFFARFPTLLDDLVLRDFAMHLAIILGAFLMLLLVFTLFELIGDIVRNHISAIVVAKYLLNVVPYFLYNVTPLSMLLAVLVTFGLMMRANEITAVKATGISIYRIMVPVLAGAAVTAAGLFLFEQFYLPHANKQQDALRNLIKGKPAQTYLLADRRWIKGQGSTIYYYRYYDTDRDEFASLSAFQYDPVTFQVTERIYATRAHWEERLQKWVCEQGWRRTLQGVAIETFRTFDVSTFASLNEPPAYFKKEVKQFTEMNYHELKKYIHDLQQGGFDVVPLRVQLQKKFAYPLITFVMAVLAIPFALSAGRRGAVTGVAIAVGIAVVYWTISRLSESMGNVSQLPPGLAAWAPDIFFGLIGGYLILKVPT